MSAPWPPLGVDRLSVIAHEMTCWECHGSGVVASEDAEPIPCPLCRDDYGRLKVVPASQLAGAVKAALDSADLPASAQWGSRNVARLWRRSVWDNPGLRQLRPRVASTTGGVAPRRTAPDAH
jgi:hypothetical protein